MIALFYYFYTLQVYFGCIRYHLHEFREFGVPVDAQIEHHSFWCLLFWVLFDGVVSQEHFQVLGIGVILLPLVFSLLCFNGDSFIGVEPQVFQFGILVTVKSLLHDFIGRRVPSYPYITWIHCLQTKQLNSSLLQLSQSVLLLHLNRFVLPVVPNPNVHLAHPLSPLILFLLYLNPLLLQDSSYMYWDHLIRDFV